jgi:hypothetical protein
MCMLVGGGVVNAQLDGDGELDSSSDLVVGA